MLQHWRQQHAQGQPRVCWELENNASSDDVLGNWHDQTKMTMAPTTVGGRDSTCVGIQLLVSSFKEVLVGVWLISITRCGCRKVSITDGIDMIWVAWWL